MCPVACPAQWKCQFCAEIEENKLCIVLRWHGSLRDAVSFSAHRTAFWAAWFPKLDMNSPFSWAKYTWETTKSLVLQWTLFCGWLSPYKSVWDSILITACKCSFTILSRTRTGGTTQKQRSSLPPNCCLWWGEDCQIRCHFSQNDSLSLVLALRLLDWWLTDSRWGSQDSSKVYCSKPPQKSPAS